MVHLGNDWDEILAGEFEQDYYKRIRYWLKKEYAEQTIYHSTISVVLTFLSFYVYKV